jgi:hypothetical protein
MRQEQFREVAPSSPKGFHTAEQVSFGIAVPKTKRIELFSSEEWEQFTEEWATTLKNSYAKIMRFAGSGDQGLDVVGFKKNSTFIDGWDNYQCKFYDHALAPTDVWVEFGKIVYYSCRGDYPPPQKYYFVAPKQVGTKLGKLLAQPDQLKEALRENWAKYCQDDITAEEPVKLEGKLLDYFNLFNFAIFDSISLVSMIEAHVNTTFHAVRFGGGLGVRPEPKIPPIDSSVQESRYIKQLFSVYAEKLGVANDSIDLSALDSDESLKKHFYRQRERFYHAESLRNFSRDTVPLGTYENLQEDIYQGVIDTHESDHTSGWECLSKTLDQAVGITIQSSPLASVTRVMDKQGICHQLVDAQRLTWLKEGD